MASPAVSSTPLSQASSPVLPTSPPTPAGPSGLSAGCQLGQGTGSTFQPVTQQNIGDGGAAYEITVTNNTNGPVTVSGFEVTFSAFGSQIGADQPTVDTSLMEPGERWNFAIGITSGIQVSRNTYLNTTCTVTSVDTAKGRVTPSAVSEPDGVQNTRQADIQQAQQALAVDVAQLGQDSTALNDDTTLAGAVQVMRREYATANSQWQQEQGDTCTSGDISGDADQVGDDAELVGDDLGSLNEDVAGLKSGKVSAVQSDISGVQRELSALSRLGVAPGTPTASAAATGNAALKNAANAISWADSQGSTINGEAQQLATAAQDYANAHPCG